MQIEPKDEKPDGAAIASRLLSGYRSSSSVKHDEQLRAGAREYALRLVRRDSVPPRGRFIRDLCTALVVDVAPEYVEALIHEEEAKLVAERGGDWSHRIDTRFRKGQNRHGYMDAPPRTIWARRRREEEQAS